MGGVCWVIFEWLWYFIDKVWVVLFFVGGGFGLKVMLYLYVVVVCVLVWWLGCFVKLVFMW